MKTFRLFFLATAGLFAVAAAGCSSSDDNNGGGPSDAGADVKDAKPAKDVAEVKCEAHDVTDFTPPTKTHKTVAQTVCEKGWADAFLDLCLITDTADQDKCTAWTKDAAQAACADCVLTQDTNSATWGPLYVSGGSVFINRDGCISVLGGSAGAACEQTGQIFNACADKACDAAWCPDTTDPDYQTCFDDAAANGTCAQWGGPYGTCLNEASTADATTVCFKNDLDSVRAMAYAICGGGKADPDAGAPDDGGTEAATP